MAKTYEQLLEQAAIIRDETAAGKNTATRVGGTITDAIDYVKELKDTYAGIHAEAAEAKTEAAAAKNTAADAKMNATLAMDTARSASLNATAASGTANAAKATADGIAATAQEAKSAAETAQTAADTAQETANSASETATAASTAAQEAKTAADNAQAIAEDAKENAIECLTKNSELDKQINDIKIAKDTEFIGDASVEQLNSYPLAGKVGKTVEFSDAGGNDYSYIVPVYAGVEYRYKISVVHSTETISVVTMLNKNRIVISEKIASIWNEFAEYQTVIPQEDGYIVLCSYNSAVSIQNTIDFIIPNHNSIKRQLERLGEVVSDCNEDISQIKKETGIVKDDTSYIKDIVSYDDVPYTDYVDSIQNGNYYIYNNGWLSEYTEPLFCFKVLKGKQYQVTAFVSNNGVTSLIRNIGFVKKLEDIKPSFCTIIHGGQYTQGEKVQFFYTPEEDGYIIIDKYNFFSEPSPFVARPSYNDYIKHVIDEKIKKYQIGYDKVRASENPLEIIKETDGYCQIFQTWGFIGDSTSSGVMNNELNPSTAYRAERKTSWCEIFCRRLNVIGTAYASGGTTTSSWLQSFGNDSVLGYRNNGEREAFTQSAKDAYVIFLGINDSGKTGGQNDSTTPLGSIDDVKDDYTQNPDTYYGNYARIIKMCQALNQYANIFCVTANYVMMGGSMKSYGYNDAIRDICEKYSNEKVYLLDIDAYTKDLDYNDGSDFKILTNHLHPTPAGYVWMSHAIGTYIDWIIRNNPSKFRLNVNLDGVWSN